MLMLEFLYFVEAIIFASYSVLILVGSRNIAVFYATLTAFSPGVFVPPKGSLAHGQPTAKKRIAQKAEQNSKGNDGKNFGKS
ncbi:hypothetical protein EYZ11_013522 [Aspergillus tanneri]|uniref:Uncharacterized protein n=1 Tax=Aspergillus tanneri TaxID=1220188 RepID=A0A4S3IXZ3_9EURO|nr:hypothetical protein EYZ11_013522 [Aspergillus tanneri]